MSRRTDLFDARNEAGKKDFPGLAVATMSVNLSPKLFTWMVYLGAYKSMDPSLASRRRISSSDSISATPVMAIEVLSAGCRKVWVCDVEMPRDPCAFPAFHNRDVARAQAWREFSAALGKRPRYVPQLGDPQFHPQSTYSAFLTVQSNSLQQLQPEEPRDPG